MLVFNVLGDNVDNKDFDLVLSDVFFGHAENDHSYVVSSSDNIIGPRQGIHQANEIDGTDMGPTELSARQNIKEYPLTISNTGTDEIILDAMELYSISNSFSIEGFEPQVIKAGNSVTVTVQYDVKTNMDEDRATVHMFIDNVEDYNELIINLLGSAQCIQEEYVSTDDIENTNGGLYFAKSSISSDAQIATGMNITFDGGNQIELIPGFSISKGSEASINIEDSCPTNDQ